MANLIQIENSIPQLTAWAVTLQCLVILCKKFPLEQNFLSVSFFLLFDLGCTAL